MLKNYPGSGKPIRGLESYSFLESGEYDGPEKVAKILIKKKFAEETVAPWEKHTNRPMVELKRLQEAVSNIADEITANVTALHKVKAVADTIPQYEDTIEALQAKLDTAKKARDEFAVKNNIPLEEKVDEESTEKSDGAGEESKPEGDNADAAGQAASAGQGE